jgi:hypothetical protein
MNRDILRLNTSTFPFFDNVFIDEAHTFNAQTKAFHAFKTVRKLRVFPITATPATNYHTIKDMIHPNLNHTISKYSSDEVFMYHFILKCDHPETGFVSIELSTILLPQPPCMLQLHSKLQGIACKRPGKRLLRLFERIVAGGTLDLELINAVIDRLFETVHRESGVVVANTVSTIEPFITDECPICLDTFTIPIQTECKHVFCLLCMRALCDIRARCPLCRHDFGTTTTVWPLRNADTSVDINILSKKTLTTLLTGVGTPASMTILDEKIVAFEKYLQTYGYRGPLVLFSKRMCTAAAYVEICYRYGKKVVTAGMGVCRKESCANIEIFRRGEADVLLCDFTYSAGFDLYNAAHMVVLDVDLRLANIVQSIGRLTRMGQVFPTVYVTILLYEHGFDHFLFTMRNTLGKSFDITVSNMYQLERFCTMYIDGTRLFRLEHFLQHLVTPWLKEIATNANAQQLELMTAPSNRSIQIIFRDTFSAPKVHFWRVNIETNNHDVAVSCSRKDGSQSFALHEIQDIPMVCEALWGLN